MAQGVLIKESVANHIALGLSPGSRSFRWTQTSRVKHFVSGHARTPSGELGKDT